MITRIGMIGLGQLGGSLALAIKSAMPDVQITGYDLNTQHASMILSRGGVDDIAPSAADCVKQADLVFLATPLRSYPALAAEIIPHLRPDTIISDVGSAQQCLHQAFSSCENACVIPSHPIAGSERTGAEAATASLLGGKLVLLTPHDPELPQVERLAQFWSALDTQIVFMPPDLHDMIYAHVSHTPHVLVFAAARVLSAAQVAASGDTALAQFLRIGKSGAVMWADIFCENREHILFATQKVSAILSHIAGELEGAETPDATDMNDRDIAQRFLPRMIASALISCAQMLEEQRGFSLKAFSGAGMRDSTAPALTDPENELAQMSSYPHALARAVRAYTAELELWQRAMQRNDHAQILSLIESARTSAHALTAALTTVVHQ